MEAKVLNFINKFPEKEILRLKASMISNQERCDVNDCQKTRKIVRDEGNPGQRRKCHALHFLLP